MLMAYNIGLSVIFGDNMNEKISVIIPAYNAEKTIERCISSVQKQTYANLEIIVVNDGSKDKTEEIVKKLSSADNRVKLISIPNGGVSHARNVGIDSAGGVYFAFVDADDYIESNMLHYLLSLVEKYSVKLAMCSYSNIDENGHKSSIGNGNNITVLNQNDTVCCLFEGKLFAGGLWGKLYAGELFDNVRLNEEIIMNEDILANFYLLRNSEKSVYSDLALYNYIAVDSSATHSANAVRANEDCVRVSKEMLEKSKGKPYESAAEYRLAYGALCLYRAYLFSNDKANTDKMKKLKKEILRYYKAGLYKDKNTKLTVMLYRFAPFLYKGLYKIHDKIRVKQLDPQQ